MYQKCRQRHVGESKLDRTLGFIVRSGDLTWSQELNVIRQRIKSRRSERSEEHDNSIVSTPFSGHFLRRTRTV